MTYKFLIKIVIIGLLSTPHLFAQTAAEDGLMSVTVYTPAPEGFLIGGLPVRNVIVYLVPEDQDEESRENESEGFFSGRYTLIYQGVGILLLFALISRLMGRGRKPDIKDEDF